MAIGGQQIHQAGSLYNLSEFAVFWTIRTLQPVAHHLPREGVEVFAVRLIGAAGQYQRIQGCQHGYEQTSQKSFEYIISFHNFSLLSFHFSLLRRLLVTLVFTTAEGRILHKIQVDLHLIEIIGPIDGIHFGQMVTNQFLAGGSF